MRFRYGQNKGVNEFGRRPTATAAAAGGGTMAGRWPICGASSSIARIRPSDGSGSSRTVPEPCRSRAVQCRPERPADQIECNGRRCGFDPQLKWIASVRSGVRWRVMAVQTLVKPVSRCLRRSRASLMSCEHGSEHTQDMGTGMKAIGFGIDHFGRSERRDVYRWSVGQSLSLVSGTISVVGQWDNLCRWSVGQSLSLVSGTISVIGHFRSFQVVWIA